MKTNAKTIKFTLWDVEFEASVKYYPGRPARTSGPPDNWEPEEADEVEINDLTATFEFNGKIRNYSAQWLLDSSKAEEIEDAVIEIIGAEIEQQNKDEAEALYQAHLDTLEMFNEMGGAYR